WVAAPAPGARLKDEFFVKLVLAGLTGVAEPRALIERQRREYLQSLRDLDRMAAERQNGDPTVELLIEGAALHLQADLAWLDLCDQRLFPQEASDGSPTGSRPGQHRPLARRGRARAPRRRRRARARRVRRRHGPERLRQVDAPPP